MSDNHFAVWRQALRACALALIAVFFLALLFVEARAMTPGEKFCAANYDIAGSLYNLANMAADKDDYNRLIAKSLEGFSTEDRATLILIVETMAPFVWSNRNVDKETVKGHVLKHCLRHNGPAPKQAT